MTRIRQFSPHFVGWFLTIAIACLSIPLQIAHAVEQPTASITSFDITELENGGVKVAIAIDGRVSFTAIQLHHPPEMVLDLLSTGVVSGLEKSIPVKKGPLDAIEFGWFVDEFAGMKQLADGRHEVDRLRFLLRDATPYKVYQEPSFIVIEFGPPGEDTQIAVPTSIAQVIRSEALDSASVKPETSQPTAVTTSGAPLAQGYQTVYQEKALLQPPPKPSPVNFAPGGRYDLLGCLEIAQANHLPLQIAAEEVKLAQLKLDEARRGLYPTASVKWQESNSEISGGLANSVGRRFNLEFQQPLFTGGQLWETYQQAKVNLTLSKLRYEKTSNDLGFDVAKAYYNLAAAKRKISFYEEVLPEAERVDELMNKRVERGLSRNLERLSAQASKYQIMQQIESSRSEIALAALNLQNALRVEAPVDVIGQELDRSPGIPYSEEECLRVAMENRVDLRLNELLVEFGEYGRRIAKSRGGPQVNLNGLVGHGAEDFESEDLTFENEWFVGVEVKVPWGKNTVKSQTMAQDRLPNAGQVDSTKFLSHTLEMVLFDREGYATRGEALNAEIVYQRAVDDWQKTEATVKYEVKESYLNYMKATYQLEGIRQRAIYGEEQVAVLRGTADVNEIPPSDVMKAVLEFVEIKVSEIQARAEQWIAVAAMNKAVGMTGFFD